MTSQTQAPEAHPKAPRRAESDAAPARISIVTPNYNGAQFIEQTIRSVTEQGYPSLDYIIVDGASDDASMSIIERHRASISRVICEPDKGHADALNKGFAAATGEIMGWINSDDVLLPHALNFVGKIFRARPDVEWITGRPSSMDEEGKIGWIGPLRPWSRLRFLSGDNKWIQQESTFWRRSLWERAGAALDLRYDVANDFDLWRRFFRHTELHAVDRNLGCFRIRAGQRSAVFKETYEAELRDILNEELKSLEPEYRAAFGRLLPESAGRQRLPVQIAADPRFKICDPPIISPGEALGWRETKACAGEAHWRAAAPSELARFRDLHKGRRCFIMGNGPSLNATNLALLENEIVFACNAAFLLFDRISWRPTYYACVDSRVLPDRAAEIDAMLNRHPAIQGFFPSVIREHGAHGHRTPTRALVPPGHNRHYFHEVTSSTADLPWSMFSADVNDVVVQPCTVAITMMQIAAYMGFSEIVLIGCDTNYVVSDTVARSGGGLELTSTKDDDVNHFDPRYFGKNRKWHDPKPERMIMHYEQARAALDQLGVSVYNATVGGKLEVFPRRPLDDFFGEGAAMPIGPRAPQPRVPNEAEGESPSRMKTFKTAMAFARRSPLYLIATIVGAVFVIALMASLIIAPSMAIALLSLGFAAALGLIVFVAMKLRGFIVELSRQINEIANGASRPTDGEVIGRIEMEEELSRLRLEVARLKGDGAARGESG